MLNNSSDDDDDYYPYSSKNKRKIQQIQIPGISTAVPSKKKKFVPPKIARLKLNAKEKKKIGKIMPKIINARNKKYLFE